MLLTHIDLAVNDEKAAAEHLTELFETMKQAPNPQAYQLACHAGLAAEGRKDLEAAAYAVLKTAVQLPWTTANDKDFNETETTGKLDSMVNRYLATVGDIDAVRQYFDAKQAASQTDAARYGGDYGLYKQWNDLGGFANEAARNNIPPIVADYLGRVADFDAKQYSPPDVTYALALWLQISRSCLRKSVTKHGETGRCRQTLDAP